MTFSDFCGNEVVGYKYMGTVCWELNWLESAAMSVLVLLLNLEKLLVYDCGVNLSNILRTFQLI